MSSLTKIINICSKLALEKAIAEKNDRFFHSLRFFSIDDGVVNFSVRYLTRSKEYVWEKLSINIPDNIM